MNYNLEAVILAPLTRIRIWTAGTLGSRVRILLVARMGRSLAQGILLNMVHNFSVDSELQHASGPEL